MSSRFYVRISIIILPCRFALVFFFDQGDLMMMMILEVLCVEIIMKIETFYYLIKQL